jgi:integrase
MATYAPRTDTAGKTIHRFVVRRVGAPVRVFTATTKTEARKAARAYESKIDEGRVQPGKQTVDDAIDFYLASDDFRKMRTKARRSAVVEWWSERLGHLALSDLREVQRTVQRAKAALLTEGGLTGEPVDEPTVNRYLAALGKVFRVAEQDADMGALLLYNPARKVGKFDETDRNRDRIYTDDEFWKLLAACRATGDRRLPVLFLCAMSSAVRIGELELVKRSNVNRETGEIPLYRTKNGRLRIARVSGMALEALDEYMRSQPPNISGFLFAGARGAPRAPRARWDAARKEAGVLDTGWHTCRHTALTWYASLGASELELREHGGHKTLASLAGYIHRATSVESAVAPDLLPEPAAVRHVKLLAARADR